jgi:hypothetical protein
MVVSVVFTSMHMENPFPISIFLKVNNLEGITSSDVRVALLWLCSHVHG